MGRLQFPNLRFSSHPGWKWLIISTVLLGTAMLVLNVSVVNAAVLNLKNVRSLVSYDGRLGNRSYGKPLPAKLHLTLVELEAGRSSQSTLPGREEMTVESLYLSRSLAEELAVRPTIHRHHRDEQMQLMETPVPYGKTKISKRVS